MEDEIRTYRETLFGNYRIIYRFDIEAEAAYVVAVYPAARLLDPETLD
jgi:mRNA-degrading endonuclease RelE of RelBE toxin-antitoxin system